MIFTFRIRHGQSKYASTFYLMLILMFSIIISPKLHIPKWHIKSKCAWSWSWHLERSRSDVKEHILSHDGKNNVCHNCHNIFAKYNKMGKLISELKVKVRKEKNWTCDIRLEMFDSVFGDFVWNSTYLSYLVTYVGLYVSAIGNTLTARGVGRSYR